MSNTVDLVKAAQSREYSNFVNIAKEALLKKVSENEQLRDKMKQLRFYETGGKSQ